MCKIMESPDAIFEPFVKVSVTAGLYVLVALYLVYDFINFIIFKKTLPVPCRHFQISE